ncbi:hypothetical protein [Streptomyces sp. NPDC046371]|uniref:alpha/beta fold hydrolase n=1 Tax=Streptomyces sp. NPDC046371 TaxID=3154916 RepID=UPI0033EA60C6
MREAIAGPGDARIRRVEIAGREPARVCVHGAGGQAAAYFTHVVTRPPLAGRRTLMADLLGSGLSDRPADLGYRLEDHADALTIPRTLLVGALSQPPAGTAELEAVGVRGVTVPDAGHNIVLDNPQAFAEHVASV